MNLPPLPACIDSGSGPLSLILLHGIASGATSWNRLRQQLQPHYRIVAWDAPGYGDSPALAATRPTATDYARALRRLIETLGRPRCVLVGHSLGALIAAAYAAHYPETLAGLVLADPAQGYAHHPPAQRRHVRRQRPQQLQQWGADGYAEQRAAALLAPGADAAALEQVRQAMRRLQPHGFIQANHLLADADIWQHLPAWQGPCRVLCGELDTVTPLAGVQQLAARMGTTCIILPGAGHASYIDAPDAFAQHLRQFTESLP